MTVPPSPPGQRIDKKLSQRRVTRREPPGPSCLEQIPEIAPLRCTTPLDPATPALVASWTGFSALSTPPLATAKPLRNRNEPGFRPHNPEAPAWARLDP